ncbi:MAG: hypothetical protein IGR80_10665 [Synechococcales cyanobacterium K44_A2020_017]|nr:hypothetical protein [Synechococcales cyanobacterium K32_A2020_035]MBF2095204.1 hypothetical protein [Synechococcales cyanobacterium K44_A2020_017]
MMTGNRWGDRSRWMGLAVAIALMVGCGWGQIVGSQGCPGCDLPGRD